MQRAGKQNPFPKVINIWEDPCKRLVMIRNRFLMEMEWERVMESDSISLKIKLLFHFMFKNERGVTLECKLHWLVYRDYYQLAAQSWYIMSIWETFSWRRLNQKPSVLRVKVKSLSRVWLFATPWIVASQAPLSMGFSRQVYWGGLPFPSPGDLPNTGMESGFPALWAEPTIWATREPQEEVSSGAGQISPELIISGLGRLRVKGSYWNKLEDFLKLQLA